MSDSPAGTGLHATVAPLTAGDIAAVLDQFELGDIESIRMLDAGSSQSPKAVVTTSFSMYLLKRIAPGRADRERLHRQHAVLRVLSASGFPVATLQATSRGSDTIVERDGCLYEVHRWIDGRRYGFTAQDAKASGSAMALMHDLLRDSKSDGPTARGYHGRADVIQAARALAANTRGVGRGAIKSLAVQLSEASGRVDEHWAELDRTVVHGDWHPGNLLFGDGQVNGVIDFESARVEPPVTDLANGLLQGTLRRDPGSDVDHWPVAPDMELFTEMGRGYRLVARTPPQFTQWSLVPDLMIEALAVETIVTLHRKGLIRDHGPESIVPWINARIAWIDSSRDTIHESLGIQSP